MRKPDREQVLLTPQITLPASATWWQALYGNVGVANGATLVTGSGTSFLNLAVGQAVSFLNQPGTSYTIASIASNTSLRLATAFTGATTGSTYLGMGANPVFHHLGAQRIKGSVYSSVAPGTIAVQFSPDGTNWPNSQKLSVDANNAGSYPFDFNLQYPYFRFVVTDAGAGSTVQIQATVFEDGSGLSTSGNVPPAPPSGAPYNYTPLGNGQYLLLDAMTARSLATIYGAAIPAGATLAVIQVGTGVAGDTSVACNVRDDGTAPTSTTGGLTYLLGVQYQYNVTPLSAWQIIGTSAGPTTIRVAFYK